MDCGKKWLTFLKTSTSLLLAVLLSFSSLLVYAAGDENGSVTDESVFDLSTLTGEFSGEDPAVTLGQSGDDESSLTLVEVSTEEDLRALATRVNSGDNMAGHLVKLKNNIHLNKANPWVPIGNDALVPFSGVFDGQGFAISGMTIAEATEGGLFGYLVDAKVRNITITDFSAPHSTSGLFFSAVRTSVIFSRSNSQGVMRMAFASPFAAPDYWDGNVATSWEGASVGTVHKIKTGAQLARLASLVNAGTNFAGETFILAGDIDINNHAWTPIGEYEDLIVDSPFSGSFVGNGYTISGLDAPLFAYTEDAQITGVVIDASTISGSRPDSGGVGALIGFASTTNISEIHVKNSTITGSGIAIGTGFDGVGGVVGSLTEMSGIGTYSNISKVFVDNTTVTGDINVGGVVGGFNGASVSECVVYKTTLNNTGPLISGSGNSTGGIVGALVNNDSAGGVKDCLVFGVDFGTSDYYAGIAWSRTALATVSDTIVSDVRTAAALDPGNNKGFIGVGNESNENVSGAENIFTDSDLETDFISNNGGTVDGVNSNYWLDIRQNNTSPVSGQNANLAMSAATLTNKTWVPNSESWTAVEYFLPQITALTKNTWNNEIPMVSAIAAVTPIPLNSDENYKDGASKILLPSKINVEIGNGITAPVNVTWTGYDHLVGAQLTKESINGFDGVVLVATSNTVSGINLTATIGKYKKDFTNLTIADTSIKLVSTDPQNNATLDVDGWNGFTAKFEDNITANPLAAGTLAKLEVERAGGYVPLEVIPIDPTITGSKLTITGTDAFFDFSNLHAGNKYKLTVPAEAFHQQANEKALTEEIIVEFSTFAVGRPVIKTENDLSFAIGHNLQISDLLSGVNVKDFDGTLMYDGKNPSATAITPQPYTGSDWDPKNIESSRALIINSMGNNTVVYLTTDDTIFDATTREAGTYELHIFAKNLKGKGSAGLMVFAVQGAPTWLTKPEPIVHIPWTDDKKAVIDAAMQGAIAQIKQKGGNPLPCNVEVQFTETDWTIVVDADGEPAYLDTKVVASDSAGTQTITEDVIVFLDRPLYWTTTPSPVTMYLSTPRQVEKRINIVAMNFKNDIVEYEHWKNDYRKPGTYYVDLTSERQQTTTCGIVNCKVKGHPSEYLNDTFIVNIIDTPGFAIPSFWGNATAELLRSLPDSSDKISSYAYSKDLVTVKPSNFTLPSFVPQAMLSQAYGRMEINYDDYRWNLYSNTLDTNHMWSDLYNLEANLSPVSSKNDSAIQIDFKHVGKLFGTVEFDVSLDKAREIAPNLPKENLGLYRYDGIEGKLVLVSGVVENGKWASALIDEVYPTTYVLKARSSTDNIALSSEGDLNEFYLSTKKFKDGVVSDGNDKLIVLPKNNKDLDALMTGETNKQYLAQSGNFTHNLTIVLAVIVAVSCIAMAVLYLVRRRGEK